MHLHFMKYLHNLTKAWWYWHGWFWLNTIRNTILYRLCNSLSTCRLIISVHCFILIWFLCIISLITIREVYVCFQYQLTVYIHVAKRAIVRNFMIWFTWCLLSIIVIEGNTRAVMVINILWWTISISEAKRLW